MKFSIIYEKNRTANYTFTSSTCFSAGIPNVSSVVSAFGVLPQIVASIDALFDFVATNEVPIFVANRFKIIIWKLINTFFDFFELKFIRTGFVFFVFSRKKYFGSSQFKSDKNMDHTACNNKA